MGQENRSCESIRFFKIIACRASRIPKLPVVINPSPQPDRACGRLDTQLYVLLGILNGRDKRGNCPVKSI